MCTTFALVSQTNAFLLCAHFSIPFRQTVFFVVFCDYKRGEIWSKFGLAHVFQPRIVFFSHFSHSEEMVCLIVLFQIGTHSRFVFISFALVFVRPFFFCTHIVSTFKIYAFKLCTFHAPKLCTTKCIKNKILSNGCLC